MPRIAAAGIVTIEPIIKPARSIFKSASTIEIIPENNKHEKKPVKIIAAAIRKIKSSGAEREDIDSSKKAQLPPIR
jgi:hypothetical protein